MAAASLSIHAECLASDQGSPWSVKAVEAPVADCYALASGDVQAGDALGGSVAGIGKNGGPTGRKELDPVRRTGRHRLACDEACVWACRSSRTRTSGPRSDTLSS